MPRCSTGGSGGTGCRSCSGLARREFQPVEGLNLLAAAWLQFMIRDWLSHGRGMMERSWELDAESGDD